MIPGYGLHLATERAHLQTLAERDTSGRDDLQVYDLENDRPVEAKQLEEAGDRIG